MIFDSNILDNFTISLNEFCFSGHLDTLGLDQHDAYELANVWVRSRLRVVDIVGHRLPEARAELAELRLSERFVDFAMEGHQFAHRFLDGGWPRVRPDLDWIKDVSRSARLRECIVFAREKGKPLLCPFTGNAASSNRCAGIHLFLHTAADRACMILPDPVLEHSSSDRVWLFPKEEMIVVCGGRYNLDYLVRSVQRIIKYKDDIRAYLNNGIPKKAMICEESTAHIGHYTWNVVSGWPEFFAHTVSSDVDFITSYEGWRVFGGVEALYPERLAPPTTLIAPVSEERRFELMLENNAMAVALKGTTIHKETADRILNYCRSNITPGFASDTFAFCARHHPIVMLTIRIGNRCWQEQVDGYRNLIIELCKRYPNIGFILDGLNVGFEAAFVQMDVASEMKIADAILDGIDSSVWINSIGSTVPESLVLCSAIDFFIAPLGAGLAKTRWICNKTGLVFSNSICLEDNNYDGHLYDYWRDDLVKMYYLNKNSVKNIDDGHLGQAMRANFSMDWRVLLNAVIPHLDRIVSRAGVTQ